MNFLSVFDHFVGLALKGLHSQHSQLQLQHSCRTKLKTEKQDSGYVEYPPKKKMLSNVGVIRSFLRCFPRLLT